MRKSLHRQNTARPSLPAWELAVHALAQLPQSIRLELGGADQPKVVRLAAAYGISPRVVCSSERPIELPRFITPRGVIELAQAASATFGELVETLDGLVEPSGLAAATCNEILAGHRVVILTNYPAHYRVPLLGGMARRLAGSGAQMHVMFLSDAEAARPWLASDSALDFGHEFLRSVRVPVRQRAPLVPIGLERRLRSFRPSIILSAGFSPLTSHRAARTARALNATFGVWSGETSAMPTAQQRGRHLARQRIARMTDFSIAYGFQAAVYLRGLRAELPIVIGRNTAPVPEPRSATLSAQRREGGLEIVLLGDLASPRKGVDIVIEALKLLPDLRLRLSVIGGGKLLGPLAAAAAGDGRIRFLGALSPAEVRCRMQQSDVFLFPTRSDVFGLALVEAMGSGLATVVSKSAGAVDDLAVDGYNAVVVEDHDPAVWARAIRGLVEDAAGVDRLGASARATIENRWSMEHAIDAMVAGLRLGALCPKVLG